MKTKQKYLVIEHKEVFDGHGSGEDAGIDVFVSDNKMWGLISKDEYYAYLEDYEYDDDEIQGVIDECKQSERDLGAQDGYNCFASKYTIIEISTKKEAARCQSIIDRYNNLIGKQEEENDE